MIKYLQFYFDTIKWWGDVLLKLRTQLPRNC